MNSVQNMIYYSKCKHSFKYNDIMYVNLALIIIKFKNKTILFYSKCKIKFYKIIL